MLTLPESVIETAFRDYSFYFQHISLHFWKKKMNQFAAAKYPQLFLTKLKTIQGFQNVHKILWTRYSRKEPRQGLSLFRAEFRNFSN
jgi:hypothetical protein